MMSDKTAGQEGFASASGSDASSLDSYDPAREQMGEKKGSASGMLRHSSHQASKLGPGFYDKFGEEDEDVGFFPVPEVLDEP